MRNIFLLMLFSVLIIGCDGRIETTAKVVSVKNNFVFLDGTWRKTSDTSSRLPDINAVSIICDKSAMICTESKALLSNADKSLFSRRLLFVLNDHFDITEWTDQLIKAERKAPVADIELRVSLIDKSAERSFRETKARGSETANTDVIGHWILE